MPMSLLEYVGDKEVLRNRISNTFSGRNSENQVMVFGDEETVGILSFILRYVNKTYTVSFPYDLMGYGYQKSGYGYYGNSRTEYYRTALTTHEIREYIAIMALYNTEYASALKSMLNGSVGQSVIINLFKMVMRDLKYYVEVPQNDW